MTTFETGRKAERVAAEFLAHKGCTLLARNWRNRYCEIDIVATRDTVVYFCEVKYRRSHLHGTGLEYITPAKLKRMRQAAKHWVYENQWRGAYQLCAIEVSGADFRITNVVKDIY